MVPSLNEAPILKFIVFAQELLLFYLLMKGSAGASTAQVCLEIAFDGCTTAPQHLQTLLSMYISRLLTECVFIGRQMRWSGANATTNGGFSLLRARCVPHMQ